MTTRSPGRKAIEDACDLVMIQAGQAPHDRDDTLRIRRSLDEQRAYYERVMQVIHWINETIGANLEHAKGYWISGPNPYYEQLDISDDTTEHGLVLTCYYGSPHKLSTPLGGWSFSDVNGRERDGWQERVNEKLGLELVMDEVYLPDSGQFGPAYRVLMDVDGNRFEPGQFTPIHIGIPAIRCKPNASFDAAKRIWNLVKPMDVRRAERQAELPKWNHSRPVNKVRFAAARSAEHTYTMHDVVKASTPEKAFKKARRMALRRGYMLISFAEYNQRGEVWMDRRRFKREAAKAHRQGTDVISRFANLGDL